MKIQVFWIDATLLVNNYSHFGGGCYFHILFFSFKQLRIKMQQVSQYVNTYLPVDDDGIVTICLEYTIGPTP